MTLPELKSLNDMLKKKQKDIHQDSVLLLNMCRSILINSSRFPSIERRPGRFLFFETVKNQEFISWSTPASSRRICKKKGFWSLHCSRPPKFLIAQIVQGGKLPPFRAFRDRLKQYVLHRLLSLIKVQIILSVADSLKVPR